MTCHVLDANMRAADAHYAGDWRPEDFDACACCGTIYADPEDDDRDPRYVQSKGDPSVCQWCADTIADE